jgi:NAD(P)-dependent dehydrogenase (short-subunit alcohol dehydrogenase family)
MSTPYPIVLVTGASSGVGKACAETLHGRGCRVYGASRSWVTSASAGTFRRLRMDVTSDSSVQEAVSGIIKAEGRIDALVNNAGYALAGPVEETSVEEAKRQFETNFFGALRVANAVLPGMRRQGSGVVIQISSLGGVFGLPFQGMYSASKFALEGLSEAMRYELAPFGVRVVLVEPGDVRTSITANRIVCSALTSGSAYAEAFGAALAVIEKDETGGSDAAAVAHLVDRIISGKAAGQVRFTVGRTDQRLSAILRRFLPYRVFEKIISAHYAVRTNAVQGIMRAAGGV